ncbi:O-antigen ligase family protein [Aureibaculum conchae]|uniref:O-antigen ligase family protein n=1 Tax=Aureibaculum sp. 2308TA14-22 TaxID=3108392 RepID=UPI0033933CF7
MKKVKNLFLYGLLLFAFFPITPNRLKGLPVILLFAIALFTFITNKKQAFNFKKVIFYASLYILYILSLFFTDNFVDIDKTLTTRLSILIFPILFGLVSTTKIYITPKQIRLFLTTYFVVSIIYCYLILLFFYQLGFLTQNTNINLYYSHLNHEMWGISQHPIYASLFISISVLFGIELLFTLKRKLHKMGILVGIFLLFSMLLFLSRKGVLLALVLASVVYMVYRVKSLKQKKYVLIGLVAVGLMILVAPVTQKRFKEVFIARSYNQIENTNSTSIRFGIYKCAIEKIKEKPIFGHGIGDVRNELANCYAQTSDVLLEKSYHSHNQYLGVWLDCGIIGLIIFFLFLFVNFKLALGQKNILFFSLLSFFSILMLFDNILEQQSGVILFSLIINFFAFINIKNHKNSFNFDELN